MNMKSFLVILLSAVAVILSGCAGHEGLRDFTGARSACTISDTSAVARKRCHALDNEVAKQVAQQLGSPEANVQFWTVEGIGMAGIALANYFLYEQRHEQFWRSTGGYGLIFTSANVAYWVGGQYREKRYNARDYLRMIEPPRTVGFQSPGVTDGTAELMPSEILLQQAIKKLDEREKKK